MSGKKIRLSKSSIGEEEKDAVLKVLDHEFLGMGEEVMLFEKEIKAYLKTDYEVVCVNTGTSALHLSLEALDLKSGDEVLVPSLTYIASYQAISATGATAISVDINPNTLFIDIDDAKRRVTNKTKVIMPVHYASSSKGIDKVYEFAKEHDLRVIEDAAQGFGCKDVGTKGDIICFSFDGIKNITSGEGGAILTGDKNVIQRVQDGRLLGVERDTQKRFSGQRSWVFDVSNQGFRYHMSNIMAAIGIVQVDRVEEFKTKRQSIAKKYINELKDIKEVEFLNFNYDEVLPHIFVLKSKKRDNLREYLLDNNIECGVHYKPNHLLSKYKTTDELPTTTSIYEQILTLPCHFDLKDDEQIFVIKCIKDFYNA